MFLRVVFKVARFRVYIGTVPGSGFVVIGCLQGSWKEVVHEVAVGPEYIGCFIGAY